jgi:hypothetical protein
MNDLKFTTAGDYMERQATNKILEMVDEQLLDPIDVLKACLSYMSDDDVEDMAIVNEFFPIVDDEENEL